MASGPTLSPADPFPKPQFAGVSLFWEARVVACRGRSSVKTHGFSGGQGLLAAPPLEQSSGRCSRFPAFGLPVLSREEPDGQAGTVPPKRKTPLRGVVNRSKQSRLLDFFNRTELLFLLPACFLTGSLLRCNFCLLLLLCFFSRSSFRFGLQMRFFGKLLLKQ